MSKPSAVKSGWASRSSTLRAPLAGPVCPSPSRRTRQRCDARTSSRAATRGSTSRDTSVPENTSLTVGRQGRQRARRGAAVHHQYRDEVASRRELARARQGGNTLVVFEPHPTACLGVFLRSRDGASIEQPWLDLPDVHVPVAELHLACDQSTDNSLVHATYVRQSHARVRTDGRERLVFVSFDCGPRDVARVGRASRTEDVTVADMDEASVSVDQVSVTGVCGTEEGEHEARRQDRRSPNRRHADAAVVALQEMRRVARETDRFVTCD